MLSTAPGGLPPRRPSVGVQVKLLHELEHRYRAGTQTWTEKEVREIAKTLMSRNFISASVMGLLQSDFIRRSIGGIMLSTAPEVKS